MSSKKPAQVFHFDLYGKRDFKYDFLTENSLNTIAWTELNPQAPEHFFVNKDFDAKSEYDEGFSLKEIFIVNGTGVVSKRDEIAFKERKEDILEIIECIHSLSCDQIKEKYNKVGWESRDGKVEFVKESVIKNGIKDRFFVKYNYRPFDIKWTYYTGDSKGFIGWPVKQVMSHFITCDNIGLVFKLGNAEENSASAMITNKITDFRSWSRSGMQGGDYVAPLYLYPDEKNKDLFAEGQTRIPNLNPAIVQQIAEKLGLTFVPEKNVGTELVEVAPIDILDYIYAVLHSPNYRKKYKEFLKIDFPRVPYPKDVNTFWKLVKLGGAIRQIHLLESDVVEKYITQYPIDGNNVVVKPRYELTTEHAPLLGKVYINETQYFDNVPQVAWDFYIGGYQPAQKWLKDRKGRKLEFDDILHYQKIIVALTETDRIMREIDEIEIT